MMKKLCSFVLAFALTGALLTGCGGASSKEVSAVPSELAGELAGTASGDTLSEVSADIMASTYMLDSSKIEEGSAFIGTGSTACEAVVLKCTDGDYPAEAKALFETRVKNQSELYASYNAGEVENLDKAIIKTSGNYTVYCVTNDTAAAEKILEKAGF